MVATQIFWEFSPRTLGKMNPFWRAYFSDGLKPNQFWAVFFFWSVMHCFSVALRFFFPPNITCDRKPPQTRHLTWRERVLRSPWIMLRSAEQPFMQSEPKGTKIQVCKTWLLGPCLHSLRQVLGWSLHNGCIWYDRTTSKGAIVWESWCVLLGFSFSVYCVS